MFLVHDLLLNAIILLQADIVVLLLNHLNYKEQHLIDCSLVSEDCLIWLEYEGVAITGRIELTRDEEMTPGPTIRGYIAGVRQISDTSVPSCDIILALTQKSSPLMRAIMIQALQGQMLVEWMKRVGVVNEVIYRAIVHPELSITELTRDIERRDEARIKAGLIGALRREEEIVD